MHKKLIIRIGLGIATVMIVGAIVFGVATFNGWDYKQYIGVKPIVAEAQVIKVKEKEKTTGNTVGNTKISTKIYTRLEVVTMMHEMVNTLIIAEDNKIWGKVPVNKDTVSKLLNMIESTEDFDEKVTFTAIANDWKNSKFANVVQDHNTVWGILEGSVGKAKDVNIAAVTEAKGYLK